MDENFGEDMVEFESIDVKAVGLVDLLSVGPLSLGSWGDGVENRPWWECRFKVDWDGCGETNADRTSELYITS